MIHKIRKGGRYSSIFLGIPHAILLHFGNEILHKVKFLPNCKYQTKYAANQTDVNKLFGFTIGLTSVHDNSARFGWYYDPNIDRIQLVAYMYVDGVCTHRNIAQLYTGVQYEMGIARMKTVFMDREAVYFMVDGVVLYVHSVDKPRKLPRINFKCFPYFGGTEAAPHTISIELK